jgi:hypothetical protein
VTKILFLEEFLIKKIFLNVPQNIGEFASAAFEENHVGCVNRPHHEKVALERKLNFNMHADVGKNLHFNYRRR